MVNIFNIIAIIGLLSIISGTLMISRKKKTRRIYVYPLLLFGGVFLDIYSIYIHDITFMNL